MANNKIDFKKQVISNKKAQELYDNSFNEVILSPEKIDDKKLKKIYEDLFYQIPKRGKSSHEDIIIKSDNVIHPETNINYDTQIEELEQTLLEKNEELLKLQIPPKEHPIFSNNTFIQEGDPSLGIEAGSTIWFTQEGYKRRITANNRDYFLRLLRQINNDNLVDSSNQIIPLASSPLLTLSSADEINTIPEAQDIDNGASLSISPLIAKDVQEYIYSQLRVRFQCIGVEKFYKFTPEEKAIILAMRTAGEGNVLYGPEFVEGYWYIDSDASCKVTFLQDTDPTTTFEPTTKTITFRGIKRKNISRDPQLYFGQNPLDSSIYDEAFDAGTYSLSRGPDVFSSFYPTVRAVKNFGQGKVFPAVVDIPIGHRVSARIIAPLNENGNPLINDNNSTYGSKNLLLNGIDTRALGHGQSDIFKFFNSYSNNNKRMINNFCYGPIECFGRISVFNKSHAEIENAFEPSEFGVNATDNAGRARRLVNLLNDPNGRYYHNSRKFEFGTWVTGKWDVSGGVYGQPILEVGGKLAVFIGSHRQTFTDWNVFYNLEDGGSIKITNASLEDKVRGYKRKSKRFFNWLTPNDSNLRNPSYFTENLGWTPSVGKLNNPYLIFPGLKGIPINYKGTDLDNNPDYTGLETSLQDLASGFLEGLIEYQIDPIIENIPGSAGQIPNLTELINMIGIGDNAQIEDNPFNLSSIGSNFKINPYTIFNLIEEERERFDPETGVFSPYIDPDNLSV